MKKKDCTPLISIDIPKQKPPQIGISFLQVLDNNFGLANLHSSEKKYHDVYSALERFLHEVNALSSIDELRKLYGSHKYSKNTDEVSKRVVDTMNKQYSSIECNELYHIHCKRGGKGQFVLHGFSHGNCFEIVLFDPEHQLHS